jgi:type II secretory pathway pseudopilin PulG
LVIIGAPRQHGDARRTAAFAFTILEIMLAIGIFALVLTAIYSIWVSILKGSQAGLKAAAEAQRSRMAIRTIEDAFNCAEYFQANMKHYLFFADTSGDMAAVSMAARLPASFPGVGMYGDQVVRRVSFYTEPGKDGMNNLILTQAPIMAVTNAGHDAYTITLARDVSMFQLAFFDPQKAEWLDEWKYTNRLPKIVQIALGMGKTAGNASKPYSVVYSLVALPSMGVTPDVQGGGGLPRPGGPIDPNLPPGSVPPGSLPPGAVPPPGTVPRSGFPQGGFPPGAFPPGANRFQ